MTAHAMKALTGMKTKRQAITVLCQRIERRRWAYRGDRASWSGYRENKDAHLFTIIKPVSVGVCTYRALTLSMEDAIDCLTGNLDAIATILT